jgi:hypothetical protein
VNSKTIVKKDRSRNYLLVEGKDDLHVFYRLLEHYKIPDQFNIEEKEGIDKLLETFEVELYGSELGRLGIVVDADTNLAGRWQRLQDILKSSGYNTVPINPNPEGTVIQEEGRPVVGIWLMPNNKIPGMLEDFVSFLISPNDVLWPLAEDIVQKVKVIEEELRFLNTHESKARIHTWLAWQKEPGKPMGQAITARYLDASALHAQQLISWIRQLFDLELS